MEAQTAVAVSRGEAVVPVRGIKNRDVALRRMLGVGDALAVMLALAAAMLLAGTSHPAGRFLWGLAAMPLFVVLFKLYGLYDRDVKRISHSTVDDLPWIFHATVTGGLLLWLYSRSWPYQRLILMEVVVFGLLAVLLVAMVRFLVRSAFSRLMGPEAALMVGAGDVVDTLLNKLGAHPEYRTKVIGALSKGDTSLGSSAGLSRELERVVAEQGVRRVIVSPGDVGDDELEELLRDCRRLSLKVSLVPRLSDVLGPAVEVDDVEGVTVLGVNPPLLPRSSRALKRVMDITIAGPVLILLSPLLLALVVAIKLDSSGPAFFSQERVGKGGRLFRLCKFRTMVSDAEQQRAELLEQSTDPHWLKLDDDPRITRVGRRLRRLSIDELPQLWNVLRGEMSLVGPRPLIPTEDERVQDWARGRVDLTPGITGYWQVLGRTRIAFEEMVKLDYLYVMNWSLWEDVRLMLKTLPVVVGGHGAN